MIHTTNAGETFDSIAEKIFGDYRATADLQNANLDNLHYFEFPAGIQLDVPEFDNAAKLKTPPWKR